VCAICLADPLPDLALGRPGKEPVNELGLELRVLEPRNPAQRICRKLGAVDSTDHCNTAWSLSAGARNPKVLRGR
jgi:hypothetical protein